MNLTKIKRFNFVNIKQESEINSLLNVMENVFVENSGHNMKFPDIYDFKAFTSYHCIKINDQIVSGFRLIERNNIVEIPSFNLSNFHPDNNYSYVEASRFFIRKEYSKYKINILFFKYLSQICENKYNYIIGESLIKLLRYYKSFGFNSLGDPFLDTTVKNNNKPNSVLIIADPLDIKSKLQNK